MTGVQTCALPIYAFFPLRGLDHVVYEVPILGALALDAFRYGAEDVGVVAADLALVDDAGEAAGAGQHTKQREDRKSVV